MSKITSVLVKELRELTGAGIIECKKALIKTNGNIELAINNIRKLGQSKAEKKANKATYQGMVMAIVSDDRKFGALIEVNCETDFVAKDSIFREFSNEVLKFVVENKISNINKLKIKFEEQRTAIISKIGENINIRRVRILEGEKIGCYLHGIRIGVLVSAKGADDNLIRYIAMHIAASKPKYITPADVSADVIANEYQIQLDIAMKAGKSTEITEKIVTGRMNKFINEISLTGQQFIINPNETVGELLKNKNAQVISFIRFEVGEYIEKI
ncbi:MAG: translation elongation factor Ts [Arsenophonus sp.]